MSFVKIAMLTAECTRQYYYTPYSIKALKNYVHFPVN